MILLHSCFTRRYLKPAFNPLLSPVCYLPPIFFNLQFRPITSPSSSLFKQNQTTQAYLSPIDFRGIAQSLLSKSYFSDDKPRDYTTASLKDLLLGISDVIPEITRRFWRVSVLQPENLLEILLGLQSESLKHGLELDKVRCLWEIFKRADEQSRASKHLSKSYEVMASMLIQVRLLNEAEHFLSTLEGRGVLLDCHELYSNLVEGYVGMKELERAVSIYDCIRKRGLIFSRSCYCIFLNALVHTKRIKLAFRTSLDLVDLGLPLSVAEINALEDVMKLLCRNGNILESRTLVKKVLPYNSEISSLVLDEIAIGYCEKRDFEDLLSFFIEVKRIPTVMATNRVINSVCICYGAEEAGMFMLELQNIGFNPDEVTYGILIGWNCREGKLKNALGYLSDILSKGISPPIYTYNALISGLFKLGMLKHARGILDEMVDRGIMPDMSTFRVLLAGYCKARKFDEIKSLISEMKNRGLIELSWSEEPLSKAFLILGLNPFTVRLKRDNDARLSEAEFFDDIGNGLYLDTDLDQYENHVNRILEDSAVPNFNSFIRKECISNNLKSALLLVEEMLRWGQELLLPDFSELVRRLCSSRSQIKSMTNLLEKLPQLACKLDQETLNLVVQAYCKKGLLSNAKFILEEMLQKKLCVKNETYSALLMSLSKKGNMRDFDNYWDVAKKDSWLPALGVFKDLLTYICRQKKLGKALQLLEIMLLSYPYQSLGICHTFLEIVCATGFSGIALGFLEQLQPWFVLDHAGYNNLIRGLFREGKFDVAFAVLNDMLDKNLAPCLDVSVLLINQLCGADLHERAIALKDIILKEHSAFSTSAHCALIHGFYNSGNTEKADTLFQDILSKGLILDSKVCNVLIQRSFKANDLRKVGELLGFAIRKSLVTLSSYRSLVRMMCMTGRTLHALSLKNLMLGQSTLDGLVVYNILIFYLLSSRNNSLVNKILDEMDEKKVVPNEVTYNFLVYGFLHCKDICRSVHYLTTMIGKKLKPTSRSMRVVISSLCNVGELQKALEFSQEMESRGWSHGSVIQNAITEGLLSHGKIQEAENFVDTMQERFLTPDNINYDNLVKQFCQYGRLDKAVHLMNIMLKKHNVPISSSYDAVICGFCSQKKLERALDLYSEMSVYDFKPKIKTQEMLVHCFCQYGRTEEAEHFLMGMIQDGETPTREMFCSVINNLRMEKNLKKASEIMQAMQQVGYEPDFETHWSLISNLSGDKTKCTDNRSNRFLSRLLSESGFSLKKRFKSWSEK
ncbi:hypothetical protein K1719_004328 [Acacia pycnantha]|nr:hypothetical protein K1719_004328 [Acacia pycnantha]